MPLLPYFWDTYDLFYIKRSFCPCHKKDVKGERSILCDLSEITKLYQDPQHDLYKFLDTFIISENNSNVTF